jgi:hypothetical protein
MPTRRARRLRTVRATPTFRVPATILSRVTIWIAGAFGVIQGTLILASDPSRFTGPSYITLTELPGAPQTWGAVALVAGVLILLGSWGRFWRLKAVGLTLLSAWAFVFSVGIFIAIFVANAPTTGALPYTVIGAWTAMLVLVDEGPRHERSARAGEPGA